MFSLRRVLTPVVAGIFLSTACPTSQVQPFAWHDLTGEIKLLELASGGRLGVAIVDIGDDLVFGYRADELFPMCSTFKLLLVAAVLARADRHEERLDRIIRYSKADLVANSPTSERRIRKGGMTVRELCEAAMTLSDNTAANLLISTLGGPSKLTAFARSLQDRHTRLDRLEPTMSESAPGDVRDTTTPASMAADLHKLAFEIVLSQASRSQFDAWLTANKTGDQRLRAGFPKGLHIGDKTGSGSHGTTNDVAFIWPSNGNPIFVAVYLTGSNLNADQRSNTIATVGREIAKMLR